MMVELYQEENKTNLRKSLATLFHDLGYICPTMLSVLQGTALPMELARDVKERNILDHESLDDIDELKRALDLAVLLMGHGDELPIIDFDYMDVEFVSDLLHLAASESTDIDVEEIQILALEVILAFNLQFGHADTFLQTKRQTMKPFTENYVLVALKAFVNAMNQSKRIITERLLVLANRSSDPLRDPKLAKGKS